MKKTLKMLSILLTLALVLAVSGCENGSTPEKSTPPATVEITSLTAPSNFTAKESTRNYNAVVLSWDKVDGATEYVLYQSTKDDVNSKKEIYSWKLTEISDTSKEMKLDTAGTTYYFWVEATTKDSKGKEIKSPLSPVSSYSFKKPGLTAPKYVTAVQSTTTINAVTVSWQNNGAGKYWLYYNTADNKDTALSLDGKYTYIYSSKNSHDIPLPASGTYYFWVVAEDSNGTKSGFSTVASCKFETQSVQPPVNVTATQNTGKNSVRVSWDDNGAENYVVYYSTSQKSNTATKSDKYISTDSTTKRKYADIPCTGTESNGYDTINYYYFWVKAVDGNEVTSDAFSEMAFSTFSQQVVPAPTGVKVEKSTTDTSTVTVTWTKSENAKSYNIYYKTQETVQSWWSPDVEVKSYEGTTKDVTLTSPSGTYYFWVKAVDEAGIESDYSSPAATITF
ncbi:MAG: hypothetical protein IKA09_13755 [Lachnospiraceae bacterium]|nr:hypothetical protein [Lachnospiraceae bacterium]